MGWKRVFVFEEVGDAGESVAEDDFLSLHPEGQRSSVWVLSSSLNTLILAESIDFAQFPWIYTLLTTRSRRALL